MNEEIVRREVQQILGRFGVVYLHIPRNTRIKSGIPDIWGINGRRSSVAVEVKIMEPRVRKGDALYAREIADNQRVWLDWLEFDCQIPCFLAVGTKVRPRRLFIVRWPQWIEMEKQLWEQWQHNPLMKISVQDLETHVMNSEIFYDKDARAWLPTFVHPLTRLLEPMYGNSPMGSNAHSLRLEAAYGKDEREHSQDGSDHEELEREDDEGRVQESGLSDTV